MTSPKKSPLSFDGSENIDEIIRLMPEAGEILYAHGLGCAGCAHGVSESLRNGILGHGFDESDVEYILRDLNEAAEDLGLYQ
jgi:hybrid cluster-associated redox disulfide protein